MSYTLFAAKGCGSAIVEALLTYAGLSFILEDYDFPKLQSDDGRLKELNPLRQVPTLLLPNGNVMTESAAITLHIVDHCPDLAPKPDDPARSDFQRWLIFLVTNIYPTFVYGDFPTRWVPESAAGQFRKQTDHACEQHWHFLESQINPAPWFLGKRFSALDIFICVMTHWRPRRNWFRQQCPKLSAIAERVDQDPALAPVWTRNFSQTDNFT